MTSRVGLEVDALHRFRSALGRLRDNTNGTIDQVSSVVQSTLERLGNAIIRLRGQVEALQQEEEASGASLENCQRAAMFAEEPVDCSSFEEAYLQARVATARAEAELRSVEELYEMVDREWQECEQALGRSRRAIGEIVDEGQAVLSETVRRAERVHDLSSGTLPRVIEWFFPGPNPSRIGTRGSATPHAPASGEGKTREGAPNAEGVEGRSRHDVEGG